MHDNKSGEKKNHLIQRDKKWEDAQDIYTCLFSYGHSENVT